jgi:DNA-binding IclR family transcriptional regulator
MLNPYETRILITLLKQPKYQNTTEISKKSKISWNTTEKYLEGMHAKGWLEKKGRTKIYWKAIIRPEDKDEE